MTTRRSFLKYALASGVAGAMPDAIARAAAITPEPGTTFLDAEHVVILMQENRSFDHVFGALQGVRGFKDPRALRQSNGNSVFVQTDKNGETYTPWRMNIQDSRITWMGSIPHTRNSQVDAWNGGQHNNWLDAKRPHYKSYQNIPITMGHYTREDLPFYYALADAFTVCDQNYCGAMTSTTPNRLIFWTGTVRDQQKVGSNVYMRNPEILEGGMTWTTFPERLEQAGVPWKFYQNEISQTGGLSGAERAWLSNFSCNVLECFDKFRVDANSGFHTWIEERIEECRHHIDKLEGLEMLSAEKKQQQMKEASELLKILKKRKKAAGQTFEDLTAEEKGLFEKAFVTNKIDPDYRSLEAISTADGQMQAPKGDVLAQFRADVKQGKLPTVSWLAAPEHFSDHPTSAWFGAWYVSEVMNILTENPEVWKKTIFILTYDENDGYFDHGCSYVAPNPQQPESGQSSASITDAALEYTTAAEEEARGVTPEQARSGPIGLGFRVPMVIASPWSRGGWVNSQLFDHSSTLRFLEQFVAGKFGKPVRESNISSWRRAISGDLTSCFRPYDPAVPALPYHNRDAFLRTIEAAKNKPLPTGYSLVSSAEAEQLRAQPGALAHKLWQEPGVRVACALPYELTCEGNVSADAAQFEIALSVGQKQHGARSAGAPFNIYCRNLRGRSDMQAGTYAVAAGESLNPTFTLSDFENGQYDIDVHAPNGFYRHFGGGADTAGLEVTTSVNAVSARTASLTVRVKNMGHVVREVVCQQAAGARPVAFSLAAGQSKIFTLPLSKSHMWYDVKVTDRQHASFVRHFAGRVETGQPSFTDPQMG
ncbi:phosphocholine-specific phospholipase C [Acetobacter orientalis]|uniref:phosphocholine-specific phospholipase C n=1 Tax=Acetobacter orientalis TaxID=146474 RepID=UPI0039EA2E7A